MFRCWTRTSLSADYPGSVEFWEESLCREPSISIGCHGCPLSQPNYTQTKRYIDQTWQWSGPCHAHFLQFLPLSKCSLFGVPSQDHPLCRHKLLVHASKGVMLRAVVGGLSGSGADWRKALKSRQLLPTGPLDGPGLCCRSSLLGIFWTKAHSISNLHHWIWKNCWLCSIHKALLFLRPPNHCGGDLTDPFRACKKLHLSGLQESMSPSVGSESYEALPPLGLLWKVFLFCLELQNRFVFWNDYSHLVFLCSFLFTLLLPAHYKERTLHRATVYMFC